MLFTEVLIACSYLYNYIKTIYYICAQHAESCNV